MKSWTLLIIQVVFGIVTIATAQIPTNGLVAWYPFNGNANDLSGNGHNGTVFDAILTTDRFGNTSKAYSFNGTNARITSMIDNLPVADSSRSLSIWIQSSSSNSAIAAVGYGDGSDPSNMFFINYFKEAAYLSNTGVGVDVGFGFWGNNTLIDQNWHNVIASYSKADSIISLWVDGILITQVKRKLATQNTSLLNIGVWEGSRYWNGKIDDIRIYKQVLSQSEIIALYNEGKAPVNNPPGFISIPDTVATEGLPWSYSVIAVDVDKSDIVAYQLRSIIAGMTLTENAITWTPSNANVGVNTIIVRATDSRGAFSDQTFRVRVANINQQPTFTSAAPSIAVQGQQFSYQAQASDPDVGDVLSWQLTTAPQGMSISSSGLVTWTPSQAQVGSHNVIIQVSDAAGIIAQQSFTLKVTNVNDTPIIATPLTQKAMEDVPFSLQLIATDPDSNQVYWFVVEGPESLKINLNSGLLTWIPRQNVAGTTVQTRIRATDAVLSDTITITIFVKEVNDPPVITTMLPDQFKIDTLYSIPLSAKDEEGDSITWSIPKKPATMSIIGSNLVWAPTTATLDTITIIATDGNGYDTLTQLVQVLERTEALRNTGKFVIPNALFISSAVQNCGKLSIYAALPLSAASGSVSLYSVSGRKIADRRVIGPGWYVVSFSRIPKGTYLVRLNAQGLTISRRISSL